MKSIKNILLVLLLTVFLFPVMSSPEYAGIKSQTTITEVAQAPQCKGTTKKGLRCKRRTKDPSGYCWQHIKQIHDQ